VPLCIWLAVILLSIVLNNAILLYFVSLGIWLWSDLAACHYVEGGSAECHFAECHILSVITQHNDIWNNNKYAILLDVVC
jgi:hypothetical protein